MNGLATEDLISSNAVKESWRFPVCQKIRCTTIETSEMHFSYDNRNRLYKDLSLQVEFNSKICLIGENGCGKTTLLKLFLKRLEPTFGNVYLHDRAHVGYFSQHHIDQFDMTLTCIEILEQRFPNSSLYTYQYNLKKFGINEEDFEKPIKYLSAGQKSRVAFAIIFMKTPNLLVLDEPTCHLDESGMEVLEDAVKKYNGGVIIVSHDQRIMNNVCTDLWCLRDGEMTIIRDGCIV